jgi:hypothetical protein
MLRIDRGLASTVFMFFAALGCQNLPTPTGSQSRSATEGAALTQAERQARREMSELWASPAPHLDDNLIADSLLAEASRQAYPARAAVIERATLGRALVEAMSKSTLRANPPQQQETLQVRSLHWLLLDRPRAVRTAVVRVPVPEMASDQKYQQLAQELRTAAQNAHNIEGLLQSLAGVQTTLEVQRMRMPPVAADGRVVPLLPQDYELNIERVAPEFAQQASALIEAGQLSSVFASSDAYQFLFCEEIIDATHWDSQEKSQQVERLVAKGRIQSELAQISTMDPARVRWSTKEVPALLKLVWRR